MPYSIEWYIDRRVTHQKLYDHITLDDVRGLNADSIAFQNAGTPLVHMIIDISKVEKFPTNLASIREMMKKQGDAETVGWVLLVGAHNPVVRFIASIITQLSGENIHFRLIDSLNEAIDFLHEHDATLRNLNPVQNKLQP